MKVVLNKIEFSRDIHKVVNIFYPNEKIEFHETCEDFDFKLDVKNDKIICEFPRKEKFHEYFIEESSIVRALQRSVYLFFSDITGIEPPYGFLIGIRPSKIALDLIKKGYNKEQIITYYKQRYLTSTEKAELCYGIALLESNYITENKNKVSVYIGMPFCPTRCSYCSFASNPIKAMGNLVKPYLKALEHEIHVISKYLKDKNLKVQCIYFGGGTPTSVGEVEFEYIMNVIHENIYKHHEIEEYTVECGRPDSITEGKLLTMKSYGVHRISINPQTMNDGTLKRIGRGHDVKEVTEKFNLARRLGFDNINMDMIVGLLEESVEEINITCKEILKLQPENLTVHGMSLKRASILHEEHLYNPEDYFVKQRTEINRMYDTTRTLASDLSMKPYYMYRQKNMVGNMENIGYCKEGKECIYNILMIEEKQTIIAFGADAISKIVDFENKSIERCANVKDVKLYIDRVDEMIKHKVDSLDRIYG
jgi:oxygen-independent coproporphyrinogen-3 oxidase